MPGGRPVQMNPLWLAWTSNPAWAGGPDSDGDGIADASDNCPNVKNPGQEDLDNDLAGDVCDSDADGDGVCDTADVCPGFDDTVDTDGDGLADGCDDCPLDDPDDTDSVAVSAVRVACGGVGGDA